MTLCNISQPTAVRYLLNNFDAIAGMDELMQMAVIELVRKEAKTEGGHRVCYFSPCVVLQGRQGGAGWCRIVLLHIGQVGEAAGGRWRIPSGLMLAWSTTREAKRCKTSVDMG